LLALFLGKNIEQFITRISGEHWKTFNTALQTKE